MGTSWVSLVPGNPPEGCHVPSAPGCKDSETTPSPWDENKEVAALGWGFLLKKRKIEKKKKKERKKSF